MAALLSLAVRVVVLLGLALIASIILRRRSASLRATVWTVAFAAALLMPLTTALVPAWRVPVWEPPATARFTPVLSLAPTDLRPSADVAAAQPVAATQVPTSPTAADAPIPAARVVQWPTLFFLALSGVALLLVVRIVASHRRLNKIVAAAVEADPLWYALVEDTRTDLQIPRAVSVRMTGATNVPAVAGLWKPVLLLPVETTEWPLDLRRAIVLHELAHVARWDALGQLIGQVACAIYWFVPLVWYGARRASVLREHASDDIVLRAGMRPSAYAESLVSLVSAGAAGSSAALAMAQPSRLQERVMAILNPRAKRDRLTWRSMMAVSVLVFSATIVVGAVQPVERETPPAPVPAPDVNLPTTPAAPKAPAHTASPVRNKPAAPIVEQSADRLCAGRPANHTQNSSHDDGKTNRWMVRIVTDGCSVDIRTEGDIEYNADFTDVKSISPNGFFRLDVTDKGVRHQLDIEPRNGALTRTWRVDGKEQPYDNQARAWFAAFLIELDRRTAIGVDIRLPLLMKQGGVNAVLTETGLMDGDYARSRYYANLARAAKLSPAEVTRILKQAATLKTSDYYANELVTNLGSGAKDAGVRAALIDLLNGMTSDYYIATSMETIIGSGAPGAGELDVLMRLVPRLSSDHYKLQVLAKVMQTDALTASQTLAIANIAASISNDYYACEALKSLAGKGLKDDAARRAFFGAAAKIRNDHYLSEVLQAVLAINPLTERDLMDVVSGAKGLGSDHYKSQVLERTARHGSANDRVRSAALEAAAGMAKYYADQVRRAAGK